MTKKNRERLSKHFRKLGVDNPYKKEKKTLTPLPPIAPDPIINPDPDQDPNTPEEDKKND